MDKDVAKIRYGLGIILVVGAGLLVLLMLTILLFVDLLNSAYFEVLFLFVLGGNGVVMGVTLLMQNRWKLKHDETNPILAATQIGIGLTFLVLLGVFTYLRWS